MMRWITALALLLAAAAGWAVWRVRSAPPEVRVTVVSLGPIADVLATNGRVEPAREATVRAERAGLLRRVLVTKGQSVAKGAPVAELENADAAAGVSAAEARIRQLEVERDAVSGGGRAAERAAIEAEARQLALRRSETVREMATVRRLVEKNAATREELTRLEEQAARFDAEARSLETRRTALFPDADRRVLESKLAEARAALGAARARSSLAILRAPEAGVVYQLDLRAGDFVQPGDVVAGIGTVEDLLVKVFVDEPELGRVAKGLPVEITWDAAAGRKWQGEVEGLPLRIVPLGTRQVGEVPVKVANPDRALPVGANVNAAIRSRQAARALRIPKESLRRENGVQGVYLVQGESIVWREVKLGITSVTEAEVVEGLEAGDQVALASDTDLRNGMAIRPVNAADAP